VLGWVVVVVVVVSTGQSGGRLTVALPEPVAWFDQTAFTVTVADA
jgi:acetyl-CoA carboxylase alpha subunit